MNSEEKTSTGKVINHLNYKKWLFLILGSIFALVILLYAGLSIAASSLSLPGLKYNGQNVGLKKINEISSIVNQDRQNLRAQKLNFSFEDQNAQKTLEDLTINIDVPQTTQRIFDYGKVKQIFPNFSYLKALVTGNANVESKIIKSKEFESRVQSIFNQKEDATNASLIMENGAVKVVAESPGFKIDTNDLARAIEERISSHNFSTVIVAKKIPVKSNINSASLEFYKASIQEIVSTKFIFASEKKKIYPKDTNILSFIDLERTVLSQKITFSDQAIDDYLNSVSKQFNVKGSKKKISSLDNSIIDEGTEGTQIDVVKSRENIKAALEAKTSKVQIVVTTAPIQEEVISPGFNPGKYPGKFIEVNLSQQMLYTFDGANLINSYKVSTGKWSMPTPQGEYTINSKDERAYSQEYGLYMPYWMAFIGSQYGIHELPEWPDGTKEGESHLGTPVSHGCVRLGQGSAQEVYNWTEIGTPVYIHE